jgi:hypothetical protein
MVIITYDESKRNTNEPKNRMFARLQEAFASEQDGTQATFLDNQTKYYQSVKHIIPSATSGLAFNDASRTLNPIGTDYENPVVDYPDNIFIPTTSPELSSYASRCATSTIDQLLAIRNPSAMAGYGCGWMYTPPKKGSSQPVVSQGFYGDKNGPANTTNMKIPEYKKWYFNLEDAKKQILMDKCNAMSSCKDLTKEEFNTQCGWCDERSQGVPVDINGRLLYSYDPKGNCSTDHLYTSASDCPAPTTAKQAATDRTCDPINGQLPVACIKNQILTAGCGDGGALSMALSAATPTNYIENLPSSDAVKIYNRHVSPPFNTDIFVQGRTTTDEVLKEVRALASNMKQPADSAIGAAARDLCIRRGAFKEYDMCNEFSDDASPPFLLECVQKIFLSLGGTGAGTMYPTEDTLTFYNSKGSLGAVRQYVQGLVSNTKSTNYNVQREAMIQLLGITPDQLIVRAPYVQGIEVFWFVPAPGIPLKTGDFMPIRGMLRRTIETNIVNLEAGPSRVAQLNGNAFACMIQLTDVRTPADFKTTFQVTVDDGFFIAVNEPADIDKKVFNRVAADEPGLFQNIGLQGPTNYTSTQPCTFYASSPNIMKIYFEDAGGGWNALKIRALNNTAQQTLIPSHFSLTCERAAPFLNFEVDRVSSEFRELRNPDIFSQFCYFMYISAQNRTDDRQSVPGKKGFIKMNSSSSCISLRNIAFQSWKTMTFAVRFTTMPVKGTFFSMASGQPGSGPYCCMVAIPNGNGTLRMQMEYRGLDGRVQTTAVPEWWFNINQWYYFTIINTGSGLNFRAQSVAGAQDGNGGASRFIDLASGKANTFYGYNATWSPAPGQAFEACDVGFGTALYQDWASMYKDTVFNYDIAWIHYFDYALSDADIARDAKCEWVFTQFPKKLNTY